MNRATSKINAITAYLRATKPAAAAIKRPAPDAGESHHVQKAEPAAAPPTRGTADWRETVTRECQADIDTLLDECINLAAHSLLRNGGLDPTVITLNVDGGWAVTLAEYPQYPGARDQLVTALKNSAPSIRSFAIIGKVRDEPTDKLIEIHLEHRDIAIHMLWPYNIPDPTAFDLDTPRSVSAKHRLFVGAQ